ncbi:MAG: hypothetical protein V7459_17390 [Oceanicoccus sp.]
MFTVLSAAAGVPDIRERIAKGDKLGTDVEHKNYIDGVNNLDYWTGKTNKSARNEYFYYAESNLQALRIGQWKLHFFTRENYYDSTTKLELPWIFNLRQDPYESYDQAPGPRADVLQKKTYLGNAALANLVAHIETLKKYPPSQKANSLSAAEMIKVILEH